jgi:NhaP-type Na+/H+ or K+/H+ antiporter
MPLTAAAAAVAGRVFFALPWPSALLVGVILSPTDPVFASAIVGREEIPGRVRHLLNVESGVNDGLALPFVLLLLALPGQRNVPLLPLLGEVAGGLVIGVAIAATAGFVRRLRVFSVARSHEPLLPFAIAIVILSAARVLEWNIYLAGFAGGMTMATCDEVAREEFHDVGERLSEVLKLAAVLLVAITVSPLIPTVTWRVLAFSAIVLTVARIVPILVALIGSGLTWPERLVAAWFGPKGFASVIYGLMLLRSDIPDAGRLYVLVAITIVMSIVVHSSTDVPIVNLFGRRRAS